MGGEGVNGQEDAAMAMATAEAPVVAPPPVGRPGYTGAGVAGLVIAATAPLWILVPEGLDAVPFVAPLLLVPLAVAAALWRGGSWGRALAGLTAGGLLVLAAPQAGSALAHPDSFFDFFPVASLVLGAVLAGVASLLAVGSARRGRSGPQTAPGERVLVVVAAAGLLVLGLGSGALTVTGQHTVSAVDRFAAEPVGMHRFEFVPAALTARPGRSVRFVVRNDDLALHTFTIDELGVDVIVKPRSEALVEFPAGDPGTYTLYCRPHTQDGQGMVGTFTVR